MYYAVAARVIQSAHMDYSVLSPCIELQTASLKVVPCNFNWNPIAMSDELIVEYWNHLEQYKIKGPKAVSSGDKK